MDQGPTSESIPNNTQLSHPRRIDPNVQARQNDSAQTMSDEPPTVVPGALGRAGPEEDTDSTRSLRQSMEDLSLGATKAKTTGASFTITAEGSHRLVQVSDHRTVQDAESEPRNMYHQELQQNQQAQTQGLNDEHQQEKAGDSTTTQSVPSLAVVTSTPTDPTSPTPIPPPGPSPASAHHQPSKRLSRLLSPTPATAPIPSITRTTSHPVLTVLRPSQSHSSDPGSVDDGNSPNSRSNGDNGDHVEDAYTPGVSSTQGDRPHQTTTSPVQELVSKVLASYAVTRTTSGTSARSNSQNNLQHYALGRHHARQPLVSSSPASTRSTRSLSAFIHHQHSPIRRTMSAGTSSGVLPPGVSRHPNDLGGGGEGQFLVSKFLNVTPSSLSFYSASPSSSAPKSAPLSSSEAFRPASASGSGSGSGSGLGVGTGAEGSNTLQPYHRRRVPVSLRMTSTTFDNLTGTGTDTDAEDTDTTPTIPMCITSGTSAQDNAISPKSPWNPVESISRTQQKLLLQRASSQDDINEEEMSRRGKFLRELERIQRECRC
ncbi:hypothetical protein BGZ54_000732, partial [Gamsiella multidivaricata]